MKRALAERAKLSVGVAAAREPPSPSLAIPPQHPSSGPPPPAANHTGSNHLNHNPTNDVITPVLSHPPSPHKAREPDPEPQRHLISSTSSSSCEPPLKLPKLTMTATTPSAPPPLTSSASNLVVPEPAPSSTSSSAVPSRPNPPLTSGSTTTTTSSTKGAGHKRPRGSEQVDVTTSSSAALSSVAASTSDSGPSETSAFYLKHQNRALAVELRSLQHALRQLEKEREHRRQDCWSATLALHALQATWKQLETALLHGAVEATVVPPHPPTATADSTPPTTTMTMTDVPPSTWDGGGPDRHDNGDATAAEDGECGDEETGGQSRAVSAVEWTRALSKALAALGGGDGTLETDAHRTGGGEGEVGRDEDRPEHDSDDSAAAAARFAAQLSARAATLQERLWAAWSRGDIPSSLQEADHAKALEERAVEARMLRTEVEELRAARDAAAASERRVRRNVYRLSAGMITLEQLLAAVQDDADDSIDADVRQEVVQLQLLRRHDGESSAPAADGEAGLVGVDGRGGPSIVDATSSSSVGATAARVDALHARIADLELSVQLRDASIEEVTTPSQVLGRRKSLFVLLSQTVSVFTFSAHQANIRPRAADHRAADHAAIRRRQAETPGLGQTVPEAGGNGGIPK